jgi:heme/copper-type cytochrome/quinol oxidase subunit 2
LAEFLLGIFEFVVDVLFYGCGRGLLWVSGVRIEDEHKRDLVVTILSAAVFGVTIVVIIFLAK